MEFIKQDQDSNWHEFATLTPINNKINMSVSCYLWIWIYKGIDWHPIQKSLKKFFCLHLEYVIYLFTIAVNYLGQSNLNRFPSKGVLKCNL